MTEGAKDKFLIGLLLLTTASCAVMQSIDPVQTPPEQFQGSARATVEFIAAEAVMPRCIERGSAVLANACADRSAITITNPCAYQGESYARRLCHEMAHINSWPADHSNPPPMRMASDSPEALRAKIQ